MRKLRIPANMLLDGDVITWSQRYERRVRGPVKLHSTGGGVIFLEAPTLPDEDVAFRAHEMIDVTRAS